MRSDWDLLKLENLITVKHGFAFKGKNIGTSETDKIVLTPGNFKVGGGFKGDKFKYYDSNEFPESYILKENDLLITMTDLSKKGDTLGFPAKIPSTNNNDKYLHNQRLGLVSITSKNLDAEYLYWLLRTNKYQKFIVNSATGSTVKHTSPSRILEYEFICPSTIKEQQKIAHILSNLDDKIELNHKMNKTLEEMAQALFKSWFVDFDPVHAKVKAKNSDADPEQIAKELGISKEVLDLFPDEFEECELGIIPKGWSSKPLGSYLTIKRGGSPRPIKDFIVKDGLPWVKIADATSTNSPYLFFTKECIKEEGLKKTVLLKSGSLILSNSATPGLPKFLEIDACIHDGWLHFPEKRHFSDIYLYLLFLKIRSELISKGNGSVFTNLKTDILRSQLVVVPTTKLMHKFTFLADSIFDKIKLNTKEVNNLVKTRDTLLPKLLSGELEVSELNLETL